MSDTQPIPTPRTDARYLAIRSRLELLTVEELLRLINDTDQWCLFDTFNYDCGRMCPIAVALNLHRTLPNATDERVRAAIESDARFRPANILKGLPGRFYHGTDEERKQDLKSLCQDVLKHRAHTLERELVEAQQRINNLVEKNDNQREQLTTLLKDKERLDCVIEMRICEPEHVILKPNQLYNFTVDENCLQCTAIAAISNSKGKE